MHASAAFVTGLKPAGRAALARMTRSYSPPAARGPFRASRSARSWGRGRPRL